MCVILISYFTLEFMMEKNRTLIDTWLVAYTEFVHKSDKLSFIQKKNCITLTLSDPNFTD